MNNNIPIFLASNNKYAPFVATTIAGICYNTKSFIDFYVLDSGIIEFNKKLIDNLKKKFNNFSVEYLNIDLGKFDNFKSADYISLDTYSRFFIPLLKPKLEKVIYLDVDIVVLGDIKELYEQDLGENIIGGCAEKFDINFKKKKLFPSLKLNSGSNYFNAGVLLINTKKWLENNITEKLFNIEKEYKDKLIFADQDILNIYFSEKFKDINCRFNFMNNNFKLDYKKMLLGNEIIIRHFNGKIKPWNFDQSNNDCIKFMLYYEYFWFFAKMTDFYEIIKETFEKKINIKKKIKLFKFITILTIKKNNDFIKYKLFGFIPLLNIVKK